MNFRSSYCKQKSKSTFKTYYESVRDMAHIGFKLQNHLPFIFLKFGQTFLLLSLGSQMLVSVMSLSGPIHGYQSVPMTLMLWDYHIPQIFPSLHRPHLKFCKLLKYYKHVIKAFNKPYMQIIHFPIKGNIISIVSFEILNICQKH